MLVADGWWFITNGGQRNVVVRMGMAEEEDQLVGRGATARSSLAVGGGGRPTTV